MKVFTALTVTLSLLAALPASSRANNQPAGVTQKLREQIRPLAETIRNIVKEERQTTIALGDFNGPAGYETNYGSGITQLLAEELEILQKGIVVRKSELSVMGKYLYQDEKDSSTGETLRVIKVFAEITTSSGQLVSKLAKELRDQPLLVKDSELIAAMIAPGPIELPPAADRKQLNDAIRRAAEKSSFNPTGTRVRASDKSPFGIELLVTSKDKAPTDFKGWAKIAPRPVGSKGGLPEIGIQRNEVYAVRVFNDTKHEAAVTLTIDGVDVFTFSEVRELARGKSLASRPKYSHFVIPPGGSFITGWHKTNQRADSFLVTEYGKGAVSLLPGASRGKVGVLTVTFALAWEGDNVPEDEKGSKSATGNETGFGPPTKVDQKEVERRIGVVREVVSVRYTR